MTREEAMVDIRENIKPVVGGKSLDMAIKALAQEPCGDAISRAEAINAISHAEVNFTVTSKIDFADYKCEIQEIVDHIVEAQVKALNDLPPVSPQQRTGHWIYHYGHIPYKNECSECGKRFGTDTNYCPNCGAKMEVIV